MSQNQIATVRGLLDKPDVKTRMREMLGKEAGTFGAALVQLTKQNQMLAKCDPGTVVGAALTAAALRLPIDPNLGQAYVVPYGKDAQFQLGYRGLIQLAQRSGSIKRFTDVVIPKGALNSWNPLTEDLDVDFDALMQDTGDHKDDPDGYAVFLETASGFTKTVFWSHAKAMAHGRRFSKSFNSRTSPWQTDKVAMCMKTVIIHALKRYAPLSVEMQVNVNKDQGVVDWKGNVQYPDNPLNRNEEQLPRADFGDQTGDVHEVSEEDLEPKEKEPKKEPAKSEVKDEEEPKKEAASSPADDEKEKKHTIEIIENAILDEQFNGDKVFEFFQREKYIAASAKSYKDVPLSKLNSIKDNLNSVLQDFALQ